MAPKRKAASGVKAKGGGKKTKAVEEDLKTQTADKGKTNVNKVDSSCPVSDTSSVFEDYSCMLNLTNIDFNFNKFYLIQLLQQKTSYYLWTRWGRVGEPGASKLDKFDDVNKVKKAFAKKFKDKTDNKWDERENFVSKELRYTLVDAEQGDEEEMAETVKQLEALDEEDFGGPVAACPLDKPTQKLIKLIFDNNIHTEQITKFEIDMKKLPLGKLNQSQIDKGLDALKAIEDGIKRGASVFELGDLSSIFYSLIPHSYGRKKPPTLDNAGTIANKVDMLLILADIKSAQSLQKEKGKKKKPAENPHPLDINYRLLKCKLEYVQKKSNEHKIIDNYIKATRWGETSLVNAWKVDREGEEEGFAQYDSIDNRRLLWHGTNIESIAAILKSGLRIMPQNEGRFGAGLYFTAEHGQAVSYSRRSDGSGIMFLSEVALGKEHHIQVKNPSLKAAPPGFDSVVVQGRKVPDPEADITMTIDGKEVQVPHGKPIPQPKFSNSDYENTEYLIYRENQHRIRYLVEFK